MHKKQFQEFILCLNEARFFEAHEALEVLWFPRRFSKNEEIKLLKGYINAAVSFELIKRSRKNSAKRVFQTYLKYKELRPHSQFTDDANCLAVEECIDTILSQNGWEFLLS